MGDIIADDNQIEQILQRMPADPEQIAEGLAVIDLAGAIRYCNPAWAVMHGYSAADRLIERHISDFHTDQHMKALVNDFIEETRRRGRLAGPIEHLRSDGAVFCSHTEMTAARDKDDKPIALIVFASDNSDPARDRHHLGDKPPNLTAQNEQLRNRITELESKLAEAIAREKADAAQAAEKIADIEKESAEAIAAAKAQAEETIASVKKESDEQVSKYRSDVAEKTKETAEEITALKTEAEQTIAEIKNDYQQHLTRFRAESEVKIADEKNRADKADEQAARAAADAQKAAAAKTEAEQREKTAIDKFDAQAGQLSRVTAEAGQALKEHKKAEKQLKRRITELTKANEELQNQLVRQKLTENTLRQDREQLEQRISRQIDKLAKAAERLRRQIASRKQAQRELAVLQEKLDKINSIAHKHL